MKLKDEVIYEEEITLAELGRRLGIEDFSNPTYVDISDKNIQILSYDGKNMVYKPLTHFIVKEGVVSHYALGDLRATSNHRVLHNKEWIELSNHPDAHKIDALMDVVDVSVQDTNCYFANGYINHNTTPGGSAIPFHASVRIALTGGTKIENKDGEVIGINVAATIKKNKVAPPHKKVDFQIHFGKGIVEHEELFDVLRAAGPKEVNGQEISVSGEGAWKLLKVVDKSAGVISVEKKFTKNGFKEMLDHAEYGKYLETLIDEVLITHTKNDQQNSEDDVEE